jgi:hypothetical protein
MNASLTEKEFAEMFYPHVLNNLASVKKAELSEVDVFIELVGLGVPKEHIKGVSELIFKKMENQKDITLPKTSKKRKYSLKSKMAPVSSISSILLGGIIALIASFSFLVDILATRNPVAILIDIAVMILSYLTVWQGIYYTIVERVARERMEGQWEYQIKPVIDLLTENAGRIDAIEHEILATGKKLNTTLDYVTSSQNVDPSKLYILPGATFKFISKILVLIFFTFSSIVYVSAYPLGIVHYFILGIYLTWWAFITAEYKLFGSSVAWIYAMAPIMVIPTFGILMSSVYGLNITVGILFGALLVYVYSYYTWACYVRTGFKILDLKPVIYQIKERLKEEERRRQRFR